MWNWKPEKRILEDLFAAGEVVVARRESFQRLYALPEQVIPPEYLRHAHHWLILHGRYVCQARKPKCDACVVCDLCASPDKRFDCGPPQDAAQRKASS